MKDKIECEVHGGEYSSKKASWISEREEPKPSTFEMEKSKTVFRNSEKLEQCDEEMNVELKEELRPAHWHFQSKKWWLDGKME